jgi:hypothetical protein
MALHGDLVSSALDPHKRAAMLRAIDVALTHHHAAHDAPPDVALVGWEAATLLDAIYHRASRVLIFEQDPELAESIRHSLAAKELGGKALLFEQPLDQINLDQRVHLAITSLASTWFIEGHEAQRICAIRERILRPDGDMIPRRVVHLFELASTPNDAGGIALRSMRATRAGEPVAVLGESKHFITQDLVVDQLPESIDDTIIVKPLLGGTITGLRLRTLCELAPGVTLVSSVAGVQSLIVPLKEDVVAAAGQPVSVHLRYTLGQGQLQARARALPHQEGRPINARQGEAVSHFREHIVSMIKLVDQKGRGADLDKVVGYTLQTHGDVSRLTALFWTVDEEFKKPLRELLDAFRHEASAVGQVPDDESIYELLLSTYRDARSTR